MSSQPQGPAGVTRIVTPLPDRPKAVVPTPVEAAGAVPPPPVPSKVPAPETSTPAETSTESTELPIPTMGWPAAWYGFKKTFTKEPKVPKLSYKEQLVVNARNSCLYERRLSDLVPHLVVAFVGVKGAAATTTTMVNVASIFADDTRTLVYGADFNPASGTAGARLGKEFGETISIQEFAAIVESVQGNRKLVNARLRPTRYGVRVLSADDYTKIPGEQYGTTTKRMLGVLEENCDYLLLDTPNDITTPASREVLAAADIIVFTANIGERDSLRLLRVSMDTVRELGHPQKVMNSVVVVSNAPKGATLDDYWKYLGQTKLDHSVTRGLQPGEFNGQMLLVPHDPTIALNGEVNLEVYRPETIQAYRDINVAILEQAFEQNNHTSYHALGRS